MRAWAKKMIPAGLHRWLGKRLNIKMTSTNYARQITITTYRSMAGFGGKDPATTEVQNSVANNPGELGIKLNIGGGKGHPKMRGWTIVDLRARAADIILDITREPLPYEDDSVDVIFSSHTLEHIRPQHLSGVLNEFCRVLKPQTGLLRVSVPDIETAVRAYIEKDYSFFYNSEIGFFDSGAPIGGLMASWFYSTRAFMGSQLPEGEGHVHCFDYDYLAYWLGRSGFTRIWRSDYLQSTLPELRSSAFDLHPQDSLFVEAMK